jgi:hypothetical protein
MMRIDSNKADVGDGIYLHHSLDEHILQATIAPVAGEEDVADKLN